MPNYGMLQHKVLDYFQVRATEGTFGVEIEVEGEHLPATGLPLWSLHKDGSLRGESIEYVFARPYTLEGARAALQSLNERFEEEASVLNFSNRTSVHVHYNVQQYTLTQLYTILCAWYLFENMLVRYSGPSREGNLFCLRISDAEAAIFNMRQTLMQYRPFGNLGDDKYAALNMCSLLRFGSIEFRSFRGSANEAEIMNWLQLLDHLITKTVEHYRSPRELAEDIIANGLPFVEEKLLPAWFIQYMLTDGDYPSIVNCNVRYVMDIATSCDWVEVLKARAERPDRRVMANPIGNWNVNLDNILDNIDDDEHDDQPDVEMVLDEPQEDI